MTDERVRSVNDCTIDNFLPADLLFYRNLCRPMTPVVFVLLSLTRCTMTLFCSAKRIHCLCGITFIMPAVLNEQSATCGVKSRKMCVFLQLVVMSIQTFSMCFALPVLKSCESQGSSKSNLLTTNGYHQHFGPLSHAA